MARGSSYAEDTEVKTVPLTDAHNTQSYVPVYILSAAKEEGMEWGTGGWGEGEAVGEGGGRKGVGRDGKGRTDGLKRSPKSFRCS